MCVCIYIYIYIYIYKTIVKYVHGNGEIQDTLSYNMAIISAL